MFTILKNLPWTIILSPKCLNKIPFLACCSWRAERMAKMQGFSEKRCLGKLYGKKGEMAAMREVRSHQSLRLGNVDTKAGGQQRYSLKEADSKAVWRGRRIAIRALLWPAWGEARKSCAGFGRPWREVGNNPIEWRLSFRSEGWVWWDFNWRKEWSDASDAATPDCGENKEWQGRQE